MTTGLIARLTMSEIDKVLSLDLHTARATDEEANKSYSHLYLPFA
jgi:hypothetical protein